jgi:hypothetical protein
VTGHKGTDHVNDHMKKFDRDSTPSSRIVSARLEKAEEQLFRCVVACQPGWGNKVGCRRDKTIFSLKSPMVERIGELIELNDMIAEFTTLEASIKVVIADARRIADLARSSGGTGCSHESDCINRFCLEKPQSMNCMRKFIFLVIMIFGSSSNPCHVFGLNIKDDISDRHRATKPR